MIKELLDESFYLNFLETYSDNLLKMLPKNFTENINQLEHLLPVLKSLLPKITTKGRLLNDIGKIHFFLNHLPEAIEYMKQAVEQSPKVTLYRYDLGLFYYKSGAIKEAIKTISELDILCLKTDIKQEMQEFFKEEKAYEQEVLAIFDRTTPGNEALLIELATFQIYRGNYTAAMNCYERVLQHTPENTIALNGIAELSLQLGQFKKAQIYLLKKLKLDPKDYKTLRTLVFIYIEQGEFHSAHLILNQILKYYPDDYVSLEDLDFVSYHENQ